MQTGLFKRSVTAANVKSVQNTPWTTKRLDALQTS